MIIYLTRPVTMTRGSAPGNRPLLIARKAPMIYLLTCTFLLLLLPASSDCSLITSSRAAAAITVSVNGALSVERGGRSLIDLNDLLNITMNTNNTDTNSSTTSIISCSLTYLNGDAQCGSVWPETVNCNDNSSSFPSTLTYTHHGCFNQYEMLNFRILHELNTTALDHSTTSVYITELSLSVQMLPATAPQLDISVDDSNNGGQDNVVAIHCPPQYIDRCSYTISSNRSADFMSTDSTLTGYWMDKPIPCGYSPQIPFLYEPAAQLLSSQQLPIYDAISVETNCVSNDQGQHSLLVINSSSFGLQHQEPIKLPDSYLKVKEMAITPIDSHLLNISHLIQDNHRYYKLTFPVLSTGGLYPVYSTKRGYLDVTVFTYSDVINGHIVFVPAETSAVTLIRSQYHYFLSDIAGRVVAKGMLEVAIFPRVGLKPSLRRNTGFSLSAGGTTKISSDHLDFYPPSVCLDFTVTITKPPISGVLYYSNSTRPLTTGDQITVTDGNLLLSYTHTDNRASYDAILASILCHQYKEPLSITIPVRIICTVAPIFNNCTQTVYGYSGYATPLTHEIRRCVHAPSAITVSDSQSLTNLFIFNDSCNSTSFHGYPYIDQSDYSWGNCFLPVTSQHLTSSQWAKLWYITPSNSNSSSTLFLSADDDSSTPIIVEFTIINLSTTRQGDFEPVMVSDKAVYSHIHPSQPFLRHNSALTISSPDSTMITSHYLYVQSIGYLQHEIVYQVISSPQYGLLCLLGHSETCTISVTNFTQEDILSDRLYYKPLLDLPSANQDQFTFDVYFLDGIKLEGRSTFVIRLSYANEKEIEFKQFWVNAGKSKVLGKKFLKHVRNSISASFVKLKFILLSSPGLGELRKNSKSKIYKMQTFTGEEITNRNIEYYHYDKNKNDCSDLLHLAVEHNGKIVLKVNITVAIRNIKNSNLQIANKQHELEGGESFVLSLNDLMINTGFCPEFVRVIIKEPPNYGMLIAQDSTHHNKRYLSTNASFVASDISDGLISYLLLPNMAIIEDLRDDFQFSLVDPRGEFEDEEPTLKRSANSPPNVFHILIFIIPPEGSGLAFPVNLTSTSSKQVTPLGDGKYGATLGPGDLYLTDTDLLPSEVHFFIHQTPLYGYIQMNNIPVEEFTLADVHSGNISYIQTLSHVNTDIMEDEFRYSVRIDLYDTQQRITLDHGFSFNWCYFIADLSSGSFSSDSSTVNEIDAKAPFTIRKIGATDKSFIGSVRVSAVPGNNHTIAVDCSKPVNGSSMTNGQQPDYCQYDEQITFIWKKSKHRDYITVFNDNIPEGFEPIEIRLSQSEGCIVPKLMDWRLYIYDSEDYSKDVQFSDEYITESNGCYMVEEVKENIGTFDLELIRKGNLAFQLGVICHTYGNLNGDYVDRPLNDAQSMVYFKPGQDYAHCPITIIEDQLNEQKELFYVNITIPKDEFAFPLPVKNSLCVLIRHDSNDEPVVSLKSSTIRIQESFIGPVKDYYFTIVRSGVDLSTKTELGNFYITPNGNATLGVDYVTEDLHSLSFPAWETELNVRITVINDNISEGPENFFIQLTNPSNGKLHDPYLLEVIITDPVKDATIGFQSKEFMFQETVGLALIPFYRHGDLSRSTIVRCEVTFLNLDTNDVVIPLPITLFPNVSRGECKFYIIDDNNREEVESLMVTIETDDPYVCLVNNTAIMKVVDQEDAPHVSFSKPLSFIKEPLSNNPVDFTSIRLKVTIKGQYQTNTSVCYHTVNGTAEPGVNYHHTTGEVLLSPNDSTFTISVVILSDRHSTITGPNKWFSVELCTCNHGNSIFLAAPHNATRVIIKRTFVGGAFFPALPGIHNLVQSNIKYANSTTEGLLIASHIDPAICLTPCDPEHPNYPENIRKCNTQDINPRLTRYKWEWSSDSTTFFPIKLETLLTITDSRVLQPAYFDKGVWLRCKSTAVNSAGIEGYTRTSLPVLLNTTTLTDCQRNDEGVKLNVSSELESYEGYRGSEEDLLHLSISIPNIPNHFPIITTTPPIDHAHSLLTSSSTQLRYLCSTISRYHEFFPPLTTRGDTPPFIIPNHRGLLSELFFNAYNSTSCTWEFSSWFAMHTLRNCSARISDNGLSVQLPLFIQYVRIINNTVVALPGIQEQLVLLTTGTSPSLVPVDHLLFDYLPINRTTTKPHLHKLHPIMLYYDESKIQFVFESLIVADSASKLFVEGTYGILFGGSLQEQGHIHLLKTESSMMNDTTLVTQTWLINEVANRDSSELRIVLKSCTFEESVTEQGNRCGHDDIIVYGIPLARDSSDGSVMIGAKVNGYAEQISITQGSGFDTVIEIRISLDPSLIPTLLPYPQLTVTRRVLCGYDPLLGNRECSYRQDIVPTIELEKGMPFANDPLTLIHYINQSDTIITKSQGPLAIQWYFEITVSLQFGAGLSITTELIVPFQSLQHYTTDTPTNSEVGGVEPSEHEIPIYASVLISIMMAALTIVMAMTGLIICYSLRRRYDLKKLEIEAAMQEAKWTAMEKERRHQKEQSKIITTYKKRRNERRHRQLLMEQTDHLPDNEEAMAVQLQTIDNNVCIKPRPHKPHPHSASIGPVRLVSTTLLNDHSHSMKTTPPTQPLVIRTTDDIADSNYRETESDSRDATVSATPIATVKPLPKQPLPSKPTLPYHTLSTFLPLKKSSLLPLLSTSVTSANSAGDQMADAMTPAAGGSCGWYDRHLARKKAMNSYVELYLGSKASSSSNEQLNIKKEEINNAAADDDNMNHCHDEEEQESIL